MQESLQNLRNAFLPTGIVRSGASTEILAHRHSYISLKTAILLKKQNVFIVRAAGDTQGINCHVVSLLAMTVLKIYLLLHACWESEEAADPNFLRRPF